MSGRRGLMALLLAGAALWALLPVLYPAWGRASIDTAGKDFASYYYAVRVALVDGDPWSKAALAAVARAEDTRRGVHPFLYPPPFLLLTVWIGRFDLSVAYRLWFWLDAFLALGVVGLCWESLRKTSRLAAPLIAVGFAALTALPNNHLMGQGNMLPLFFLAAGWWAEEEDRPLLAGLLVGTAAMLKMSPALFVILWIVQRNTRAVGGAVLAFAVWTVATLPLVDAATQLRFYTDILPTFASGGYNGLAVPIDLFGNHSLPNLVNHWLPGTAAGLAPGARAIATALALALLAALCWRHRTPSADPLDRALTRGAVAILGLLVPVYTYEHHLVFAVPALTALLLAVERARVAPAAAAVIGVAASLLWYDLDVIRNTQAAWKGTALGDALAEAKTGALILLFLASGWSARRRS